MVRESLPVQPLNMPATSDMFCAFQPPRFATFRLVHPLNILSSLDNFDPPASFCVTQPLRSTVSSLEQSRNRLLILLSFGTTQPLRSTVFRLEQP